MLDLEGSEVDRMDGGVRIGKKEGRSRPKAEKGSARGNGLRFSRGGRSGRWKEQNAERETADAD